MERTGLGQDVLLRDIRLLHRDGRIISGSDVYRYVMRRTWWTYPLYLLSVTPGLRSAFDWGYRTFARHRIRISAQCRVPQ
jgi:predicted DCC family thiol-disulfide oxidoreductase YuxK